MAALASCQLERSNVKTNSMRVAVCYCSTLGHSNSLFVHRVASKHDIDYFCDLQMNASTEGASREWASLLPAAANPAPTGYIKCIRRTFWVFVSTAGASLVQLGFKRIQRSFWEVARSGSWVEVGSTTNSQ